MINFLIMEEDDLNFINDSVEKLQVIFHPNISPNGKIEYKELFRKKREKEIILFLDRNILSGLIKFCEDGELKDKAESQILGIIMVWAQMNDISISAGLAIQERATQVQSQEEGLIELQKFLELFKEYPGQLWLKVAEGHITTIPKINFSGEKAKNITVNYSMGNDHYYMMVASMLQIVYLYRQNNMSPANKIIEYLKWTYDNLLVGQYSLVYAILLFTNQENIKAPKGANSNDLDRIINGCKNQAWDLSYLSNWSTFYMNEEKYDSEFLFATNDNLLKRIFIYTHIKDAIDILLYDVFSKKDYNRICDYVDERRVNRIKPDFGKEPRIYFEKLIENEKQRIKNILD